MTLLGSEQTTGLLVVLIAAGGGFRENQKQFPNGRAGQTNAPTKYDLILRHRSFRHKFYLFYSIFKKCYNNYRKNEKNGKKRRNRFPTGLFVIYSNKRKAKIRWMKGKTKCSSWNYAHTIESTWKNCFTRPAQTVSREAWSGRDTPLRAVGGDRDTPSP